MRLRRTRCLGGRRRRGLSMPAPTRMRRTVERLRHSRSPPVPSTTRSDAYGSFQRSECGPAAPRMSLLPWDDIFADQLATDIIVEQRHPRHCVEGAEEKRAYKGSHPCAALWGGGLVGGRIAAQPYERSYSALRLCTLSCESSDPMSRGRPQRGERVGAETIDQSPGDGALRRAAGDGAARSAHPGPDDRPRPPASSGVPVRGCAQADSRG